MNHSIYAMNFQITLATSDLSCQRLGEQQEHEEPSGLCTTVSTLGNTVSKLGNTVSKLGNTVSTLVNAVEGEGGTRYELILA
jgi:hypothetical protein